MISDWKNIEIFTENLSTLKETSVANHNQKNLVYITESELPVINFDEVKKKYLLSKNGKSEEFKSVDALLRCGDSIIFIEFKSCSVDKEKKGIKGKMKDSIFIFADLLDCTIEYVRNNVTFVLVYSKEKNPRTSQAMDELADRIAVLGHDKICRFGFGNYTELYFKKIITYNDEEFNKDLEKSGSFEELLKKLPCH